MTYDLYIGDRTFSSWSLRGWLMMEKFNLPYRAHLVGLYSGTMAADLAALAPVRLVPAMWPADPAARATARWLAAEMCGGFSALRGTCPMQLQHVIQGFTVTPDVQADLDRIDVLWEHARAMRTNDGPWLFGDYSLADAFYAPVVARITGYDLPVSENAKAYCATTLNDPAFKAWRAEGLKVTYDPFPYDLGLPTRDWPVS
jgi:glutathione S-transferase